MPCLLQMRQIYCQMISVISNDSCLLWKDHLRNYQWNVVWAYFWVFFHTRCTFHMITHKFVRFCMEFCGSECLHLKCNWYILVFDDPICVISVSLLSSCTVLLVFSEMKFVIDFHKCKAWQKPGDSLGQCQVICGLRMHACNHLMTDPPNIS